MEIINLKQIKVHLTKVKIHSNDTYNEIADKLMKAARHDNILNLSWTSNGIIRTVYSYKERTVDISVREFAKAQIKVKAGKQWMQLNRFSKRLEKDKTREQWKIW